MTATLEPQQTYTFTIRKMPARIADQKTIQRLMQLQPAVAAGLKALSLQRRRQDNKTYVRAGVEWTNRARATRLTRVEPGASFTLRMRPQIIPDIMAVEKFLDVRKS